MIEGFSVLGACSILGFGPLMEGMLWTCGFGVLKAVERLVNLARHGEVHGVEQVIPGQGHTAVQCATPICARFVELLEGGEQVMGIIYQCVFDSKVVHNEGKGDITGGVSP